MKSESNMKFRTTENCISCSSTNKKLRFSYIGFDSIEFSCFTCKDCGLLFCSPQPIINKESLNEIYSGDYYQNYFGDSFDYMQQESSWNKLLKKRLKKEFDYYYSFISNQNLTKKVLDLGCGDGRFLEHFAKLGWDCYGIEPSNFISEIARKKNINILEIPMLEIEDSVRYDFIFMDNVIEHLDYPAQYLEKAFKLLNLSGVMVIKTPNSLGIIERTETLVLSLLPKFFTQYLLKKLHKNFNIGSGSIHRYGNLHPPVHLSVFNKKSMAKALISAGFRKKDINIISGSEYYHVWKIERPKTIGLFAKILKLLKHIGDTIGRGEMLIAIVRKS